MLHQLLLVTWDYAFGRAFVKDFTYALIKLEVGTCNTAELRMKFLQLSYFLN
jgi:hypothetical protein